MSMSVGCRAVIIESLRGLVSVVSVKRKGTEAL